MSEIEKYYNGEIIVDFEEETELEKKYNEVAELYSKAVKKKIEYRKEIERLNNIINELKNRDNVLEEFEDWLERQKTRNSEWDNFIMVDGRLGIPISYLLDKLQELKGNNNGVWVNNLLEVIKENNIEFGSDKE